MFQYLITLGSREGEIVLDPFLGSGTTVLAADIINRRWIGIEKDDEYYHIAKTRLDNYLGSKQLDLFSEVL